MTKLEILEETYNYYTGDVSRRGVSPNNSGCYYKIGDKMCAVGRCMNEKADFNYQGTITTYIMRGSTEHNLDDDLKEQYRGHSVGFWRALQTWHDNHNNWCSNGLTTVGQSDYNELVRIYKND